MYIIFKCLNKITNKLTNNITNKMSGKKGRSSDYAYGRSKEAKIGRIVTEVSHGSSFRRSAGSRGPSDLTTYKDGLPKYSVQVKSTRSTSKSSNNISPAGTKSLVNEAKSLGTTPLVAHTHGKHHVIKYATSGKTFHAG
jgi:hypothetical protein